MFTREQVEQQIAIAYRAGFNAGYEWAKNGGNIECTVRAERLHRSAT